MTKEQLADIVDLAIGNWSPSMTAPQKLAMLETWSHFLLDLDHSKLLTTVERSALAGGWMPRPAELRTKILEPDLPTPDQAWQQAQAVTYAVQHGTELPDAHPVVTETIRGLRGDLRENHFKALYDTNRTNYLEKILP